MVDYFNQQILPNLIASAITTVIAFAWARLKFKRLHERLDYQDEVNRLMHKHIKELSK